MLPTTLSLVGIAILFLDIFAIVSVLTGSTDVMHKLIWIALILFLPILGMAPYFLAGTRRPHAH